MKKVILIPVLVCLLFSCTNKNHVNEEIIEINISEALKNRKDIPLSSLVKDVKVLELEANKECFMQMPLLWHFGEKFILVFDEFSNQMFLFGRKGNFIRKIGQEGKGPGEYFGWLLGCMNKSESHIVITDRVGGRTIVFNTMGEVLAQKELKKHFPSGIVEHLSCAFDNTIAMLPRRPTTGIDGFSSVVLFDFDLNEVAQVLPRVNDKDLAYPNLSYQNLFTDGDDAYFWETFSDTVYQFNPDGSSEPKITYNIENNGLKKGALRSEDFQDIYNYTQIMHTNFLPGKIVAWILTPEVFMIPVFYDFKTKESYSVGRNTICQDSEYNPPQKTNSVVNDVYGFEPPLFFNYIPDQGICVREFEWGVISRFYDMDCIRQREVSHPEVRDQLLTYCEDPPDDLGLVLILMEMK